MFAVLDWMGRHATKLLAAGVALGLLAPVLAHVVRPWLPVFIVLPLAIAIMRLDWRDLARYAGRLPRVALLTAWMIVVSPLLAFAVLAPTPLPAPLVAGIVLMAAAPPIVSAAGFALILGLDAAAAVVVTITAMWLVPFVLPPLALMLLGLEIDIALGEFMARLAGFVAGAFALGIVGRRLIGQRRIKAMARPLDGVFVIFMLLFAIAIMDGVGDVLLVRPGYVLLATAMGFAFNLALQAAGAAAFWWLGPRTALSAGLMSGNCNMGILVVVLADRADFDTVIFFAMAQIPMYTLPALLAPLYRRLGAGRETGDATCRPH